MSELVNFADRLAAAIDRAGSPACVGLDPVVEKLPASVQSAMSRDGGGAAEAIEAFCIDVIDAVADAGEAGGGGVPAVKPQSACFERFGSRGVAALQHVIAHARSRGLIVVLDAKRGDIGVSAEHYAAAAFDAAFGGMAADVLTVSPYLGMDTLEPYIAPSYADKGIFALVRTSNPGSDALQGRKLADGRTIAESVADDVAALGKRLIGTRGMSSVGAVVGATKAADASALRRRMPEQFFLIPGYGAQGGTLDDLRTMIRPEGQKTGKPGDLGILVNASRSVLYAFSPSDADWRIAVRDAARRFSDELRQLMA